jgi:hypothetical protein
MHMLACFVLEILMKLAHPLLALALAITSLGFSAGALATESTAYTYSFVGVGDLSANPDNVATGVASLSVEVIDLGFSSQKNANQVAFTFTNNSSSSLTDVYFDDGTLLGISSISDSGMNVDFSKLATPGNLPGGNNLNPDFTTTTGFSADSDPPVSPNGVTSGEWLTITFDLQSGKSYWSIIDALALPNGGGAGDLRIGLHVQSFADGGSASFVNVSDGISVPVPEARTYAMMFAGLGLIGFTVLRRRQA